MNILADHAELSLILEVGGDVQKEAVESSCCGIVNKLFCYQGKSMAINHLWQPWRSARDLSTHPGVILMPSTSKFNAVTARTKNYLIVLSV